MIYEKVYKLLVKFHKITKFVEIVLSQEIMSNTLEAIHLLENKLKDLLSRYEFLKEENEILLQQNGKLQILLSEREQQLMAQQKQFELLKVAKTIEGSKEDSRNTKLKINALIREIDKCITLLNS